MVQELTSETLKAKHRRVRDGFGEDLALRVHRAISWVQGAEQARRHEDCDAALICYWIGFNAAYGQRTSLREQFAEREVFEWYFGQIVRLDGRKVVYHAIWQRFSDAIRSLIDNRYVFAPFWRSQHDEAGGEDWQPQFEQARHRINRALATEDTVAILITLFDRLYVLRNQLMHGGATWNGEVNREQVRDGANILACLVPHFVDLMMDHPDAGWGLPPYPVVDGKR